jgi:hypothetical protein
MTFSSSADESFTMQDLQEAAEKIRRLPKTPLDDFVGGKIVLPQTDDERRAGQLTVPSELAPLGEFFTFVGSAYVPREVLGVAMGPAGALAIIGQDGRFSVLSEDRQDFLPRSEI